MTDFEAYFGEDDNVRECSLTLRIGGNIADVSRMTRRLQLQPTKSFGKGERFLVKHTGEEQVHPIGNWSLSSAELDSTSVERHCEFLLDLIESKKEAIQEFIDDPTVWVSIVFWWGPKSKQGGFSISADKARRLAALCQDFRFHLWGLSYLPDEDQV